MLAIPHTAGRSTTLWRRAGPPRADLEDRRVGRIAGEGEDRGRAATSKSLARFPPRGDDFREQRFERLVLDQPAGDSDPLVEPDEMRAGEGVDLEARRFHPRAQESDGRAFAVGPGDVEDRREQVLRLAQPVEQRRDPLEPEAVADGRGF